MEGIASARRADCARRRGDELLKGLRICNGDVGENLAVDLDTGLAEALDEAAVGEAVGAAPSTDAGDPETAELALFVAAVAVGVVAALRKLLIGSFEEAALAAEIAAGGFQNLVVALLYKRPAFNARHGSSP